LRAALKTCRAAWKKVRHDLSKLVSRRIQSQELRYEIAETIMKDAFDIPDCEVEDSLKSLF
jgi:hypothetical protein